MCHMFAQSNRFNRLLLSIYLYDLYYYLIYVGNVVDINAFIKYLLFPSLNCLSTRALPCGNQFKNRAIDFSIDIYR